jgi:Tfp pilus assembly protein PilX
MERAESRVWMRGKLDQPGDAHFTVRGNERGIVLVVALVLLAIVTMLGVWVLDSSDTDLKIAGNYRNAENAFSMADSVTRYASNPTNLTSACLTISACTSATGSVTTWPYTQTSGLVTQATVTVEFLNKGPLPTGSMYDSDVDASGNPKFSGVYFNVVGTGYGPNGSLEQIETNVVQVVSN